ncbi:MAG: nucleoside kinase [Prevotella sp.]|nr:nucleoside kinase [Prevotella sp.]
MLQIRCKNINKTKSFPEGTSLLEVYDAFMDEMELPYPIVAAKVNNTPQGLKFRLYQNRDVEFLDAREGPGHYAYVRSLCFVLYKATQDLFPGSKLFVEHPLERGYYCNFRFSRGETREMSADDVALIRKRMQEIINLDMPFRRNEATTEEAIRVFSERGFSDKVKLLETSGQIYSDYYMLGDTADYYYGPLVPSAGYLTVWELEPYHEGLLLRVPDWNDPSRLAEKASMPKTYEMFAEKVRWDVIMHLSNAGDVNKAVLKGYASELIQVSEALQEKKIVQIAEEITRRVRESNLKLVLITGPSSSGKTTFCKRLSIQLLACGLRPYSFSTDDYFVNRVDTPLLPNGDYDFDNIETVEYSLLEDHLTRLMNGERVEVPEYNFKTGKREWNGKKLKLTGESVLIIEGIHALNPLLTRHIDDALKFKIYISALTSISLDDHNWIPTRDNRLLRRIIRDYNKGAFTAKETIAQWKNVCAAEDQWIFPYQETADVMFNSALNIEFAVLRPHAEVILGSVPKNCPEYTDAHRLMKFIRFFIPVSDKEIPPTSIMREFVGGSSFKY